MAEQSNKNVYTMDGVSSKFINTTTSRNDPNQTLNGNYRLGSIWINIDAKPRRVFIYTGFEGQPWARIDANSSQYIFSSNGDPNIAEKGVYFKNDADNAGDLLHVNNQADAGTWQRIPVDFPSGSNAPLIIARSTAIDPNGAGNYPRGTIYIDLTKSAGNEVYVRSVTGGNARWYKVTTTEVTP